MARAVVVGAGVGGLSTAIRAAQHGHDVQVIEARSRPGGLASSQTIEGLRFDVGPYVLLDKPGLEWAFEALGLNLNHQLDLKLIEEVYRVNYGGRHSVEVYDDLERTALKLEETWPEAGQTYRKFVTSLIDTYGRIQSLQWEPNPGLLDLMRTGAWRDIPFLLRSLETVLERYDLPEPVERAVAIWVYVAGQSVEKAPSPLALVPSLIHNIGAYYPRGGIGTIPNVLAERATECGVTFRFDTRVTAIRTRNGMVTGVETAASGGFDADAVISNYNGIGTYLELVEDIPKQIEDRLRQIPLQSPGVCAYLRVKGYTDPPYLRFKMDADVGACRLFLQPGLLDPDREEDGWYPARVLGPLSHQDAKNMGEKEQREHLDRLLSEEWWQRDVIEWELLDSRVVDDWGGEFNLYNSSMNPVMTRELMQRGRMSHRSPYVDGLYLAGSSTHPGQWVSFCTVSGIHAADCLMDDSK